ncbi:hypothetical protein BsWGS_14871 [Bradybaena similaris]
MSREPCDVKFPVVNILGAVYEIFQVLMLTSAPNTPKISVSFKNKGPTCETGLHLFCLGVSCSRTVPVIALIEENCFPQLCKIVSEMQTREPQSHLALQLVNENNCGMQKTMLLWLEANTTGCMAVSILSEALTQTNKVDDNSTVLELRTLMTRSHAIQCGKEILDLLQRIKLLNPKVQLSFSLCSLTLVEFDLCDTNSISCGAFDIYCGHELFLGKSTHFICQTLKVKCSKRFEFQKKDGVAGTACLTCIACFVPICSASEAHCDVDSSSNDCPRKQDIRGHLRIQVYGPANLPFDMKVITKKLTLSPHSLLPWQKLGLQVKKSFSCTSYDMHCSAKITQRECVPSWATQCQHFCIVLAFTLNEREDVTEDNTFYRLYRHQESFADLEQQTLNKTVYSTFQEAAWSSLEDLLSKDKQKSKTVKCKQNNITDCQVDDSELFKKMIPEVANSLTDIFIRSTCMEFRSQVGALVPTSSRSSLSSHLEKSMWSVICKSRNVLDNPAISDQTISNLQESQLDDWDFSEDSLLSDKDYETLSLDSLDLDWDKEQTTTMSEDNTCQNDTKSQSYGADCRVPEKHSSTGEDVSSSIQQYASFSQSIGSYFSPEQEFDQWEMPDDFLNSTPINTCTNNTNTRKNCMSSVFQQIKTEYQPFNSVPCPEEHQFSAQTCRLEHVSSSTYSMDQTTETVTHASIARQSTYVDKLPRKRSSEYIDDDVSRAASMCNPDCVNQTDDNTDNKKQRYQSYDSTSLHSLSQQKVATTLYLDDQNSCVLSRSDIKELDRSTEDIHPTAFRLDRQDSCVLGISALKVLDEKEEKTHLKLSDEVEDDAFSSSWFDEEEIANWHAELEK